MYRKGLDCTLVTPDTSERAVSQQAFRDISLPPASAASWPNGEGPAQPAAGLSAAQATVMASGLGQLVANDGQWKGQRIIDSAYMDSSALPHQPAPNTGHGLASTRQGHPENLRGRLPQDMVWFAGYMGQFTVVVPSCNLVVLRMGVPSTKRSRAIRPWPWSPICSRTVELSRPARPRA